jgi:hypothetical protein
MSPALRFVIEIVSAMPLFETVMYCASNAAD